MIISLPAFTNEYCPDGIYCYANDIRSCSVWNSSHIWDSLEGGPGEVYAGSYDLAEVYASVSGKDSVSCAYEMGMSILLIESRRDVTLIPDLDSNSLWTVWNDEAYCNSDEPIDCPLLWVD